ncbi:MAG TPA: glycosyltransferase [Bacilli bacterium]|nr:glycosyltransferase [Bacilli bacterium]
MFHISFDFSGMDVLQILDLIDRLLTIAIGALLAYKTLFIFIGFSNPILYPPTVIKKKYGIMISARNEAAVIGHLIESIKKQNYPQELLTIFVIADNCQDNTADIARNLGAVVYERNSKTEIGKGFALSFLMDCIKRDYGILSFDGFFVFDADNLLDSEYIDKMNDAFNSGKDIITSYRNTKNFDTNFISASYGYHQYRNIRFNHIPRSKLNLSCNVTGTGFLVKSSILKDGWKWKLITEDIEFTIDSVLEGYQVGYCHEAIFYDEQPRTFKMMFRQRVRWSKGFLMVFASRGWRLLKSLFRKSSYGERTKSSQSAFQHSFTRYDLLMYIFPSSLVLFVWGLIYNGLYIGIGLHQGILPDNYWQNLLVKNIFSIIQLYAICLIQVIPVVFLEWKRMLAPWYRKVLFLFTFPFFDFLNLPITVVALFKKPQWKPIIHDDLRSINNVNSFFAKKQRGEDICPNTSLTKNKMATTIIKGADIKKDL